MGFENRIVLDMSLVDKKSMEELLNIDLSAGTEIQKERKPFARYIDIFVNVKKTNLTKDEIIKILEDMSGVENDVQWNDSKGEETVIKRALLDSYKFIDDKGELKVTFSYYEENQ